MFEMFSTIFKSIAIWFIAFNHLGSAAASACETIKNTAEAHNLEEQVKAKAALSSLKLQLKQD